MAYTTLDGASRDMARDYSTPASRLKDGSVSTSNSRVDPVFRTPLLGGCLDTKLWTPAGWLAAPFTFGESDLQGRVGMGGLRGICNIFGLKKY